jgi:hypothetical protein
MKILLSALLLLTLGAPAEAQNDPCQPDETPMKCLNRVLQAEKARLQPVVEKAATAKTNETKTAVAEKLVPDSTSASASSLRDFLPLIAGSLGLGTVSDKDGELTLDVNPEWLRMGSSNPLSIRGIAHKPAVSKALIDFTPEGVRAERKTAFEGRLGDFDDLEWDLTWAPETARWGRNADPHLDLIAAAFAEVVTQAGTEADLALAQLSLLLAQEKIAGDATWKTLDQAQKGKVGALIEDGAQKLAQAESAVLARSKASGFDALPDLVNNQPQLELSYVVRQRNELVGPDEQMGKLTWEHGMGKNMNGLRAHCSATPTLDCIESYTGGAATAEELQQGQRIALSVEYSRSDLLKVPLPLDNKVFELKEVQKWTGSFTYGRYLGKQPEEGGPKDAAQRSHLDFEAKYDDVSGDPMMQARLVLTATVTRKMTDETSAALTFVWANRPEFRGAVDKALSARAGLRLKVDKKNK